MEDGYIETAPIFSDIRAFISEGYAERYRGMVDVITAGFPCQPFSVPGAQLGEEDPRNMWPATIECIRIIRPQYAFLENVTGLLANGYIRRVFGDLAALGFNARWGVLGGHDIRGGIADGKRLWIVAFTSDCAMLESLHIRKHEVINTEESCRWEHSRAINETLSEDDYARFKRNPNDVAAAMEQLKAIGNGQVPAVVRAAWELLTSEDSE